MNEILMSQSNCSRKPSDPKLIEQLEQIPEICPATQVGKAYKSILRIFDEEFRDACITSTQFAVLVHIGILGEPSGSRLAAKLGSDPSTISRILDTLEHKEMVNSRPGTDRRTHLYSLTETGRTAIEDGLASWERARSRVLSNVDEGEWRHTLESLQGLSAVH